MINDPSIVKALLDKKSAIYSNRPHSYITHDLITGGDSLLLMNPGEKWRLLRKLMHQQFHEARCEREHITLQNAEAVQMLRDFLVEPEELMQHPRRFSNSIIMSLGRPHLNRSCETTIELTDRMLIAQLMAFEATQPKLDIWWSSMN